MDVSLINPANNSKLHLAGDRLIDEFGNVFHIVRGVPRIANLNNYSDNFGLQWNKFDKTQLDGEGGSNDLSRDRFFAATHWDQEDLFSKNVLEVGSGAGRFSRVVLKHTAATLYSVDYSDAVSANYKNNAFIADHRFKLFQASVYELPFPENSFDKVFCFGVLQHTPDFEASVKALIGKAKLGGEIVVDFYAVNGWWTKIHAKYFLRPISKKMPHDVLLGLIEKNIDWLIAVHDAMTALGMSVLTRVLPVVDLRTIPRASLTDSEFREWVVLDTFDMFSPEFDQPQRIESVAQMFLRNGASVSFAGLETYGAGRQVAVVRGLKK